jgi:hypothetical protein
MTEEQKRQQPTDVTPEHFRIAAGLGFVPYYKDGIFYGFLARDVYEELLAAGKIPHGSSLQ